MDKNHPGFKAVQSHIAQEYAGKGKSHAQAMKIAGAVLAKSSRNASAAAHKANPRLNRVKG